MRVQFTKKELEMIESGQPDNIYILPDNEGQIITAGLKINDVNKFNMFISQYLQNPDIAEQVGAELVHVDLHEPITRAQLIGVHNLIGELIYGTNKPAEDTKEEETSPEEEYLNDDNDNDYGEE